MRIKDYRLPFKGEHFEWEWTNQPIPRFPLVGLQTSSSLGLSLYDWVDYTGRMDGTPLEHYSDFMQLDLRTPIRSGLRPWVLATLHQTSSLPRG